MFRHRGCAGWQRYQNTMMTSWNGNIFRVTGPLYGEFTGHRWIPLTNASDAELWCFCLKKQLSKQSSGWWFETPSRSLWRHWNVTCGYGYPHEVSLLAFILFKSRNIGVRSGDQSTIPVGTNICLKCNGTPPFFATLLEVIIGWFYGKCLIRMIIIIIDSTDILLTWHTQNIVLHS